MIVIDVEAVDVIHDRGDINFAGIRPNNLYRPRVDYLEGVRGFYYLRSWLNEPTLSNIKDS